MESDTMWKVCAVLAITLLPGFSCGGADDNPALPAAPVGQATRGSTTTVPATPTPGSPAAAVAGDEGGKAVSPVPPAGSPDPADQTPAPAETASTSTTNAAPAPAPEADGDARDITYDELYARRQELVGETVRVVGKVFFVSQCPPPAPGGATSPCTLTGYLAHPDRPDLNYGERDQAIPLAENGRAVTCTEGPDTTSGCPGWEHTRRYRVVATVRHQVLGGRETRYVELDVKSRQAL